MDMLFRLPVPVLAAVVSLFALPAAAHAGVSHLVVPGETLSGIAAANGLSPAQLAGANGLAADAFVIAGRSLTSRRRARRRSHRPRPPPRRRRSVAIASASATRSAPSPPSTASASPSSPRSMG